MDMLNNFIDLSETGWLVYIATNDITVCIICNASIQIMHTLSNNDTITIYAV